LLSNLFGTKNVKINVIHKSVVVVVVVRVCIQHEQLNPIRLLFFVVVSSVLNHQNF